jgi:hypothetical protein
MFPQCTELGIGSYIVQYILKELNLFLPSKVLVHRTWNYNVFKKYLVGKWALVPSVSVSTFPSLSYKPNLLSPFYSPLLVFALPGYPHLPMIHPLQIQSAKEKTETVQLQRAIDLPFNHILAWILPSTIWSFIFWVWLHFTVQGAVTKYLEETN